MLCKPKQQVNFGDTEVSFKEIIWLKCGQKRRQIETCKITNPKVTVIIYGDGCVTGGRPGLQTRVYGTNTVVDRFDSYTSPPPQVLIKSCYIH